MTALQAVISGEVTEPRPAPAKPVRFRRGGAEVCFGRAENFYGEWPDPVCIVCDGPYGVSGYPGDLSGTDGLADWYVPHVRVWAERATPQTTLWFWNTEIGWATVHPVLQEFGWKYRSCHVWDKGLGHVARQCQHKDLAETAGHHRGLRSVCPATKIRRNDDAGLAQA